MLALTGITGIAISAVLGSVASAEPNGAPTYRTLSGVGSDTTQDVVNGLSEVVKGADGTKLIGSYNAFGSSTVQTKADAKCNINRPAGSGAGRNALIASLNPSSPTAGCIDFARSSSLSLAQTPDGAGLTYVPFGVDAVTYAVSGASSIPKNLSKDQLKGIYRCDFFPQIKPLLPQSGSGTRAFWLAQLDLTETTKGSCIADQKDGKALQENDGRVITAPDEIAPFSVAQYIAQSFGVADNIRGTAQLGSIDGIPPVALNTGFGIKRDVYNVVPTAKLGASPYSDVFVGGDSQVCKQTTIIQSYGFGVNPNCGSTTNRTPNP